MEELQGLIKFLKNKGLGCQKIPLEVWLGIIEYFTSKERNDNKLLNDLLKLRTYSTFPNVTANYMGVDKEYEGQLGEVYGINAVVNVSDIRDIIDKYIEESPE